MPRISLIVLIAAAIFIGGCGGSSSTPPDVTVTITPSQVSLLIGVQQKFEASVAGSTDNGVTWEVNGVTNGNATVGTVTSDGTYTAPNTVPNPNIVTVTAISKANTNRMANADVTLTSNVYVAISPTKVDLYLGKTQQFTSTVTGTTNTAVTWQAGGVNGGSPTVGKISSSGLYTAPTTATTPVAISVTAISQVDATKSATAGVTLHTPITIVVSPSPASVAPFGSQQFTAAVTGSTNTGVSWQVNGVTGGSSTTGTISTTGLYSAPHSVPTTASNGHSATTSVTVTAVSQADSSQTGSTVVTIVPSNQNQQSLPISLGVSGGNANDTSSTSSSTCCGGTLGALVSRGGNQYILSNSHILARTDSGALGDSIIQPGLLDASCASSNATSVATLSQFVNLENSSNTSLVDGALAEVLTGKVTTQGTILDLGGTVNGSQPTDGSPHAGSGIAPSVGLTIVKSGRSTGLTCSTISAINVTTSVNFQKDCGSGSTFSATFNDLVDVYDSAFSAQGDSGALIVSQSTADPVALLFAQSDSDTIGSPVSDVLTALADPNTSEKPVFVGSAATHSVAACSLPGPQAAIAKSLALADSTSTADAAKLQAAQTVRDAHAAELLAPSQVQAIGLGMSADNANEPAILLFVSPGTSHSNLPAQVDGVRTRIVEKALSVRKGILSAADSTAIVQTADATPSVMSLAKAEIDRARTVHSNNVQRLMQASGIQGVGITSSADSPGEAALLIFVIRGATHDAIAPVIDGVRTRVRETSRFRAGFGDSNSRQACSLATSKNAKKTAVDPATRRK